MVWWVLGLVACGVEPAVVAGDVEAGAPRGAPLTLEASEPLAYGATVDLTIGGAAPGETVYVLYGLRGAGEGPCPDIMGGACFDLNGDANLYDSAMADADGMAMVTMDLPASGPPRELGVQAAVVRGVDGEGSLLSGALHAPIGGGPVVDVILHETPAVDVLFVIDDSCSMAEEQVALARDLGPLIRELDGFSDDWHAGVITTDMDAPSRSGQLVSDPAGRRWTDGSFADPAGNLGARVQVGTVGSPMEQGMAAVNTALGPLADTVNAGFLRDDAQLAIVLLSDEDDQTLGPDGSLDLLMGLKRSPGDLTFNLLTGLDTGCPTAASSPLYVDAMEALGGMGAPICDLAYLDLLRDVIHGLNGSRPYMLTERADPASVMVVAVAPDGTRTELGPDDFAVLGGGRAVQLTGHRAEAGTVLEVEFLPR